MPKKPRNRSKKSNNKRGSKAGFKNRSSEKKNRVKTPRPNPKKITKKTLPAAKPSKQVKKLKKSPVAKAVPRKFFQPSPIEPEREYQVSGYDPSLDFQSDEEPKDEAPEEAEVEVEEEYKFKNYFNSEKQLEKITHRSAPEEILGAYARLIWVFASNHVRENVELDDLIEEGKMGVLEAIQLFNDPGRVKPRYNFHQACLYKIRSHVFQYCLGNANQIKTPYYIQRGLMHVGQIFKLMSNQSVAERILKRFGPATEEEVIAFLYEEDERLPKKSLKFIKEQITKRCTKTELKQILSGILNHELGSRHSYIKNQLTDVGKILHIKEKLWYTATSNNMKYARVIDLILSARKSKTELTPQTVASSADVLNRPQSAEELSNRREFFDHGAKVCGELHFKIFVDSKLYDKTYDEIADKYGIKKAVVTEIVKNCIKDLREDPYFQQAFLGLQ